MAKKISGPRARSAESEEVMARNIKIESGNLAVGSVTKRGPTATKPQKAPRRSGQGEPTTPKAVK